MTKVKSRFEGGTVLRFSPYRNYTANNVGRLPQSDYGFMEKTMGKVAFTQAFELANAIRQITNWNVGDVRRPDHTESGDSLAACMTTALQPQK